MAAITLKDLMDPLSKMAAAIEKNTQKLDAVILAVTGGAGDSLNQELFKELQVQTSLLRTIAGNTTGGGGIKIEGKQVDQDKLKEGASAIKMLGGGASSLASGLLIFMLVPKSVIKKFVTTITDLMAAFDAIDEKKVEKGSNAFQTIASSISQFAKGLALAGILFIPAMLGAGLVLLALKILMPTFEMLGDSEKRIDKGAEVLNLMGTALSSFAKGLVLAAIGSAIGILFTPIIVLAMIIIGGAFALLGSLDKTIKNGARSVKRMGNALIFFSAGLVFFALASMFILMQPVILLAMVGTLILIGGAFAILGIFNKSIRKGAVAVFLMGIGLVLFSIGYLIFAYAVKDITMDGILMQVGLLVGLGIGFGILGKMFTSIVKGAFSVAAIGIGLLVFSLGYLPFAYVTKDMTLESVAIQGGILLMLGLEFAAAGFGSLFILAGAAAFAAIGVALLALAPGLLAIQKVNFTEDDSIKLATMLSGVKSAFLGGSNADEGFFSKIGGAITGAVDSVRMIEAAAGFVAAGVALKILAYGLTAIKAVGWNDELSKELVTILNGITTAFALAGSSEQVPSSSFFGQMFGFKRTAVEEGIASVLGAGRALTNISKGLMAFQSLIKAKVKFGTPDEGGRYKEGTLGHAVTNTIGFINEAFAAVGDQGNVQAGGVFSTLFGIKKNKVAEGIESVLGAGRALTNISKGLMSFQSLIKDKVKFGTHDKDGRYKEGTLGHAVTNTVGFINEAFAAVANQGNVQAGGVFSTLFDIKKNKVAEGIESVLGAGRALTKIATGLESFQALIKAKVKFGTHDKDGLYKEGTLGHAVTNTLGFVNEAFAAVADQGNVQAGGVFSTLFGIKKNKVAEGIESVKGAGKELTNIATGLKLFQDMVDKEIDFSKGGKLATAVSKALGFVGDAFALIGGNEESDSSFNGLLKWDENLVKKGMDAVKGAGTELTNIAKGLQVFSELKDPTAVANSIKSIFTSIGDTFTFYYAKPMFKSQLDHMQGFVTEISTNAKKGYIDKAADGMQKIAVAVNSIDKNKAESFGNLFKGAGELTDNKAAFEALLNAVQEIRQSLAGEAPAAATPAAGTPSGTPAPVNQTGLQPTLNQISAALGRLNGTMSSLPGAIQSIKIVVEN
jgi:hypothetical protein